MTGETTINPISSIQISTLTIFVVIDGFNWHFSVTLVRDFSPIKIIFGIVLPTNFTFMVHIDIFGFSVYSLC